MVRKLRKKKKKEDLGIDIPYSPIHSLLFGLVHMKSLIDKYESNDWVAWGTDFNKKMKTAKTYLDKAYDRISINVFTRLEGSKVNEDSIAKHKYRFNQQFNIQLDLYKKSGKFNMKKTLEAIRHADMFFFADMVVTANVVKEHLLFVDGDKDKRYIKQTIGRVFKILDQVQFDLEHPNGKEVTT